jgi:DNA-binding NtrC family response regulator
MPKQLNVLVISASVDERKSLMHLLDGLPANVSSCSTIAQAEEVFAGQAIGLVICDEQLPDGTYRDLLSTSQSGRGAKRVIVTTHSGGWEEYLEATQLGAFDMISFPLRPRDVQVTVTRAMQEEKQKAACMTA